MAEPVVVPAPGRDTAVLRRQVQDHGVYLALAVLLGFNLLFTANFATVANLRLQLVQVVPIAIVALGMALVVATEGIDLSVGSVMALAAAVIPLYLGYGLWPAIAAAVVVGGMVGAINGGMVAYFGIQPIIATLGVLVAGRALALVLADGRLVEIFDPTLQSIGNGSVAGVPFTLLITAVLAVLVMVLVRRSVFGRRLVAVGGNRTAATLAGLPVRRTLLAVYVLSGVLAALAGVVNTARLGASDPSFVGLLIELSAITAVVVGGTPLSGGRIRVLGTLMGALLMQLIAATVIQHNLPDSLARMIQAAIIVVAVYVQRDRGWIMITMQAVRRDGTRPDSRWGGRSAIAAVAQRGGAPIVLVLVLLIGATAFGSNFIGPQNLGNIALDSSYLVLVAVGMTFVIISGGIDLSVGSLFALAGVLAAYGSRWGSLGAVALPLVVCGLIGLINGLVVGKARMAPFIVTLAAMLFARGLAFAASQEGNKVYLIPADLAITRIGQARVFGVGAPVIVASVVFAAGLLVLNRTRFGQSVYAIGGSPDGAELMGLPVARIKITVYVMSSLLAALAGILVAAQTSSGLPTIGEGRELEAIAAVVIGGTLLTGGAGALGGTLAGALLLKVIQNLINQVGTLSSYYQQVVSGVFLLIVVLIQTRLGRRR